MVSFRAVLCVVLAGLLFEGGHAGPKPKPDDDTFSGTFACSRFYICWGCLGMFRDVSGLHFPDLNICEQYVVTYATI